MNDKLAETQLIEMLANLEVKDAKQNPQGHLVFTWKDKLCRIEEHPKSGIVVSRPVKIKQSFKMPEDYIKFVQEIAGNYACDPSFDEMFNEFVQYTYNSVPTGGMGTVIVWHDFQIAGGPETLKGLLDKLLVVAEYVEKTDKRLVM